MRKKLNFLNEENSRNYKSGSPTNKVETSSDFHVIIITRDRGYLCRWKILEID